MSQQANGDGRAGALERLVIVRVGDTIEPTLTEQPGGHYQSPPQSHAQAMALVRLVLGSAPAADGARRWTAPIAGGRRVVTMTDNGE